MRAYISSVRRHFGWAALFVILLLPRTALADQLLLADFDGDGKRDFASVEPYSPALNARRACSPR